MRPPARGGGTSRAPRRGDPMTDNRSDRDSESEGAMTGATGSLTPPASDEEFIPAERREVMRPGQDPGGPTPEAPDAATQSAESDAHPDEDEQR